LPGFSVPGGGDNVPLFNPPSSVRETARRHRWKFEVEARQSDYGVAIDLFREGIVVYAHKSTRPTPEIDVVTIHNTQDEIYLPGKNRWAPIDISFYEVLDKDQITNSTAEWIYDWWSKGTINLAKSRIATVISAAGNNKRQCTLTQLNGAGRGVWEYTLHGCWPEKISPEDLNHGESTICEINLRLRYDKASEKRPIQDVG